MIMLNTAKKLKGTLFTRNSNFKFVIITSKSLIKKNDDTEQIENSGQ